jgi:DivIVA domain-containing protein
MLTAAEIRNTQFALTRRQPGYDPEDVDTFLARAEAEVDRLTRENDELRGACPRPLTPPPGAVADPLTPADVRNTRFALTRGRPGYDRREVDAFLALTEAELDRLIRANQELHGIVPPPLASHSGSRRGHVDRQPFKLMIVFALVFLACAVGCGFGIASMHTAGERSSYTQASGIAETATVTSVTTTGPKNPQTDISVLLDTPVDYRFVSDVYVPGDHSYNTGDKIKILVDPRDPSYSELPGDPDARMWPLMISTALLSLLFAAAAVACLGQAVRIRQRRREFWQHLSR